ncbi:fibronectin type III domain-containing protein [Litoribacillus peritrichatus]|uniref:Fibronectin type-III domain-containing protein n=1 Tax=Litoribacillus peritrichatus TaxID=718191 RepID=A0ABP7MJ89_9GAMM
MNFKLGLAMISIALASLTGCSSGGSGGHPEEGGITGTGYTIEGSAQKGPFLIGSTVDVTQLTDQGESTGTSITTKTKDSLGNFSFKMSNTGPTIITVDGYHYNELTGLISDDKLTLRAIYDVSNADEQSANVNILTHLTHDRVLELMEAGLDVVQAVSQAQEEWITDLESIIDSDIDGTFSQFNIYDGSDDADSEANSYLLFTSAVFYQHATNLAEAENANLEAKLAELLNNTANDFGADGEINTDGLIDDLRVAATELDVEAIQTNLENLSRGETGTVIPAADIGELQSQVIILSPAEDATVSGESVVRVSIPTQISNTEFTLLVSGEPVATKDAAQVSQEELDAGQITFNWQPYFWATDNATSRHSLLVQSSVGNSRTNSNLVNVTVFPEAKNALQLSAPANNTSFKNQVDVNLTWQAHDGAQSYTVQLSKDGFLNTISEQTVNGTEATVTDLKLGVYEWRIRATNALNKTGPWSNPLNFAIDPLNTPTNLTSTVNTNETDYDVTLNWSAVDQAQSYDIQIAKDETFIDLALNTNGTTNTITETLTIGEYYARIRTVDQNGLESDWGESSKLEVGTFRTVLGGSGNDQAKKIIRSNQGGYLILASTDSPEVSTNLNGIDDWIIRVDDNGHKVNEHVSIAIGRDRFKDFYESSDGFIYLVGQDWGSSDAILLKLNSNLDHVSELLYKPENITEQFSFDYITKWNNKLTISSSNNTVHQTDMEITNMSSALEIPSLENAEQLNIKELLVTSSNNLLVSGEAYPFGGDPSFGLTNGIYVLNIGSNLNKIYEWNNTGEYFQVWMTSVIETSNNDILISGAGLGLNQILYKAAFTRLDSQGNKINQYSDDNLFYSTANISPSVNSNFFGLFSNAPSSQILAIEFDENFNELNQKYIPEVFNNIYQKQLIRESNGSLTLLYDVDESHNQSRDIIINKVPPIIN